LKECLDRQQRYTEISNQLAASRFPFTFHFEFLPQGIRASGNSYPVMKMEWVQGVRLDRFVESNLQFPQTLLSLGRDIVEIVRVLNRAGVAHGDLQHGNILVENGKPKLIDYDGMYVPALRGWIKQEDGHPNYQLPREDSDFGPNLDNFSVWVIYLSLWALSVRPSLWKLFQGGDDCLLFRRKDFEKPAQSLILQELKRMPDAAIVHFATAFESLLSLGPLQIPLIDPDSPPPSLQNKTAPTDELVQCAICRQKLRVPSHLGAVTVRCPNCQASWDWSPSADVKSTGADWISTHVSPGPAQQPASAFDLNKQWAQIDQIPRPSDVYKKLSAPDVKPTPWPLPTPPPVAPAVPGILVSPPAFPVLELSPQRFHHTVVPVKTLQKLTGIASVVFLVSFPLLAAMGAPIIATVYILAAMFFGTWWGFLELNHGSEQQKVNTEYEHESKQRKALQKEHADLCTKLKEQLEQAGRRFDEAMAHFPAAILLHKQEATRRREAVPRAKSNLQRAEEQWKAASETAIRQFEKKKAELLPLKNEAEIRREAELKQMLVKVRESQFSAYLSQHLVLVAAIANIGEKLKKNLNDSGIRTAFDVGRISWPRGFGDARKALLVEWRRNVEATFVFKTANAIPPHEMQALESKYGRLRQLIQRQLETGEKDLKKISQDSENQLSRLSHQIKACMAQLYQAEADLAVIPKGL
jgi:DNA-binding helix-hairpin-helix protein with protein kinase domain